ncbi:hypothetical protein GCM10007933_40610 [Zoogloea oryzae]|uniref:histidine kinase n=1 Tax=Zoogloea oryzae TaxID=310767 RepID=A0ABQ6FH08_9RHOO|nr:ATP-binding protein [Zoogloea oryzae]GLT24576.1 hypothetical protein GCM10007933_40610 [Zoogloea oryzae]
MSQTPLDNRTRLHQGGRLLLARVRWITLLAVLLGLVAAGATTFAIERFLGEERARADLARDLARTTRVLALTMQGQLWDYARESAEGIVRSLAADDRRIVSVVVFDRAGSQPFVEYVGAGAADAAAVMRSEVDIDANGEVIGKVVVTMSAAPYLEVAADAVRRTMLITISMLVLGGMLIMAFLQRRLLLPMEALAAAAGRLSTGDLGGEIRPLRDDELGGVARALENMRVALLGAFEDLHAKNRELTAQSALLEQRVAERTEALSKANDDLRGAMEALKSTQSGLIEAEKLASLGSLVAGVAHELNTPLGNAITVVTTLEDQLAEMERRVASNTLRRSDLDQHLVEARQGQDILQRNVTKAADLVRGLKQLAVDQTTDMRRQFSLVEVVDEVLIMVRPRFNHTPYRIETDLAEVSMDSYPGPLGQVLTNLVLNALTHAFVGRTSGCVTISAHPRGDGQLLLVLRDDGVGIAPEVRRRLFEPFVTTKMGQGGSGLGLHIARNIVMGLLGGTIDVVSEPGRGAEFRVAIPLSAPERPAA